MATKHHAAYGLLFACLAACGESGKPSETPEKDSGLPDAGAPLDAGLDGASEPMRDGSGPDAGSCPEGPSGEPPTDYLDEFRSGTRLKARYFAAPGMPPVFAGFYDSQLSVACDFATAADGKLRCLPRNVMRSGHLGYLEGTCEQAAYEAASACSSQAGYLRRERACRGSYDVQPLEPLAAPAQLYFGTPEACNEEAGTMLDPGPKVFTTAAPVSPDSFVEGSARTLPGVCRGSLRIVEGSDGSLGPLEIVDLQSGAACEYTGGAEPMACWPRRRAFEEPSLYQDSACSESIQLATWLSAPECPAPDFIRPLDASTYLFAVGAPYEMPAYSALGGVCEPATQKAWIGSLYTLGEPKSEDDFAEFQTAPLGSGRVQAYAVREQETPLAVQVAAFEPRLRDAELGLDCTPKRFADGEFRCIGSDTLYALGAAQDFHDAACTEPLRSCTGDACEGKIVFDRALDEVTCATDDVITAVWKFRAPATQHYVKQGAACVELGAPSADLFVVDPVPFGDFPTLMLETRE